MSARRDAQNLSGEPSFRKSNHGIRGWPRASPNVYVTSSVRKPLFASDQRVDG